MARLHYHGRIVRHWQHKTEFTQYHLTETGWLLKTTGPRQGGTKVVARPKQEEKREAMLNHLRLSGFFDEVAI